MCILCWRGQTNCTNVKDSIRPNEMIEFQDFEELRWCSQETNCLGLFSLPLKATYSSHLYLT